jgi:hypothetical protein
LEIPRIALGRPSAQGHRPNGVVARLALLATRPSGPVSMAQPQPKRPGHSAQRCARTARGHHVVAQPVPAGSGLNAVRSLVGAPAARGGGAGQGGRGGDSPMCVGAGEVAGKGGPMAFVIGEDPVVVSDGRWTESTPAGRGDERRRLGPSI